MKTKLMAGLLTAIVMMGCGTKKNEVKDGPTTGTISLGVDESFQRVVEAEKVAFRDNYHFANINLQFKPENEAIADLLNDKVRGVVVTRELTDAEKAVFTREKITYRSFKFAADGIALLVHPSNKDTLIGLDQLKALLSGQQKSWKSIGSSRGGDVELVVDKANSSNIKFLVDLFGLGNKGLSVSAAGSNKEVIEYVKSHPNAMGIIGSNWISDGDNPTSLGFIRSVNVMSVAKESSLPKAEFYQPFGYNLALKKYPLRREVKIILKESYLGLGTGFVNYVCGDMGQLIVLKSGLIPLTRPITIRQYQISQ
ncbi:PstS family phosphate ABC transporter substrate-binding protein [Aquirufa sp. TARAVU-A1A]|jgi:phosphate transport system substrate-binding protein